MKIYGLEDVKNKSGELVELTIVADSKSLRQLSSFLDECANQIEAGEGEWEHEHLVDLLPSLGSRVSTDVIVASGNGNE